MKKLFIKYPILYLFLFCLFALVAGIESGYIIKNGLPKNIGECYLIIFGIIINLVLAFCFLYVYVKIKNNRKF